MEWNLITTVVLIVSLLVGYGLGLLEAHLRNSGKLKEAQEKITSLEAGSEGSQSAPAQKAAALQVWMDPDQTLNVALDGKRLESPEAGNPEQRRRLITLLTRIRPWVEGNPIAPESRSGEIKSKPASLSQPQTLQHADLSLDSEKIPDQGAKSMVQQIDAILQKLIEGTPFESKKIMLLESPGGGILVKVGKNQYESIDAVPDADIQVLLRQAVTKWEKG
jgi:hypothetical protein